MRTTKAFDRDLQSFLIEMGAGDSFAKTKEAILQQIAEEAEHAVDGYMSIDYVNFDGESEDRFDFKAYVDPYSSDREVVLAAEDETVVEWVESFDDPVWQDALLPGNPAAHVVTFDPENPDAYLALYNDGMGHVRTETFDEWEYDESLRVACAFAAGLSVEEIKKAQDMSYGWIRSKINSIYFGSLIGSPHSYKDAFAFALKNDEVCYALPPTHAWGDNGLTDIEWSITECKTYTYQDIVDACQGNEKIAKRVFADIRDEVPETFYSELEDWKKAEITANVSLADGYELLELQNCDLPVSVFYAHGGECFVADFRSDLDERNDLAEAIRAKSRVELLSVIESPEQLAEVFMSDADSEELYAQLQDGSWVAELRDTLGPDMGLMSKGEFELRVQLVNRPEDDVYVFYMQSPYGVSGVRDLVEVSLHEPLNAETTQRIVDVWNKFAKAELYMGLPSLSHHLAYTSFVKEPVSMEEARDKLNIDYEFYSSYLNECEDLNSVREFACSSDFSNHFSECWFLHEALDSLPEMRFVSTTDAKLPSWASIHNVMMQEKATFGIKSMIENGLNCVEDRAPDNRRGSHEIECGDVSL